MPRDPQGAGTKRIQWYDVHNCPYKCAPDAAACVCVIRASLEGKPIPPHAGEETKG